MMDDGCWYGRTVVYRYESMKDTICPLYFSVAVRVQ